MEKWFLCFLIYPFIGQINKRTYGINNVFSFYLVVKRFQFFFVYLVKCNNNIIATKPRGYKIPKHVHN